MLHIILIAALAATSDVPAKQEPVKLASPGFTAVKVDEKLAAFFSDHFAQQLSLQGMRVITASEVSALVGFERQKELLGCSDKAQSCLTELANALGVDALIIGSIAKFDATFQVDVKVLSSVDATPIADFSAQGNGETEMMQNLDAAAKKIGPQILKKFGRTPVFTSAVGDDVSVTASSEGAAGPKKWPLVPTVAGGVLVGAGAALFFGSNAPAHAIADAKSPSEARGLEAQSRYMYTGGLIAMGAGAATLAATAIYYFASPSTGDVQPQAVITPGGAMIGLAGVFP